MRDETMSPEMARELAALAAALAGEPVEPDLADLAELTALLREERPEPDATFTRALDSRVERGFPRGVEGARAVPAPHGAAAALRRLLSGLRSPLALGAAATVVVAAVVVGISQMPGENGNSSGSGGSVATDRAAPEAQSKVTAGGGSA